MDNSFPQIWKIIDIHHGGQMKKFVFQQIPEHYYDEILNKFANEYWSDEILNRSMNLTHGHEWASFMKNKYKANLAQNISIGVFEYKENSDNKLVGLNILYRNNIKLMKIKNSVSTSIEQIWNYTLTVMKSYAEELIGNEDYLASDLLFVCKDYRNIGLALQLLELRNNVGKKYNLKYSITLFTSSTAQKLSEKAGFTNNHVFYFNDAEDTEKNYLFPLLKDKKVTLMIKYIS